MTFRLSHRAARTVGAVGRTLIGAGLITLLFVVYQLWGTGIQQARTQSELSSQFEELRQAATNARETTPTTGVTVSWPPRAIGSSGPITINDGTTLPGSPQPEPIDPALLAALAPVQGEPIAQIQIPAIGVAETVVYGVRVSDLQKGPGVFESNPLPGEPGNAAIAGHRTTWGQPFHDLDLLQPGDEITVSTLRGEFTYVVDSHPDDNGGQRGYFIVPETGVEVLNDFGDNRLTLIACHPKFSSRQRIIVTAILQEEPVEPVPDRPAEPSTSPSPTTTTEPDQVAAPPQEDWGAGLDGDRSALLPTLVWGALFGLGLFGAWLGGHLWRRLPVYVLSTPLLAWLLYSCFVYLDQLMPSY